MVAPMVHLNGDTKQTLQTNLINASRAIDKAIEALRETCPHGRNYYRILTPEEKKYTPTFPAAYYQARTEYIARMESLRKVNDELLTIFEAIEKGETEC